MININDASHEEHQHNKLKWIVINKRKTSQIGEAFLMMIMNCLANDFK